MSAAVGFNDIPYFNRTFKKMMQVSPKEYRLDSI
ncbi:helix-turn-helix domain-containing protein [Plebeiibacterium sediminum]